MDTLAKPQDVLLAYNADFTGFTSLNEMAQPLEPESALARGTEVGVLGGTPDPDGYYEDFSARLDRFTRLYPRLGVTGGARREGLNWNAIVITLDPPGSDEADEGDEGDEGGEDDGGDEEFVPSKGGDPPLVSLSDFIVETDGGKPPRQSDGVPPSQPSSLPAWALPRDDNLAIEEDDEALEDYEVYGGEMDETEAELESYETFRTVPLDLNRPEPTAILGFVVEK